MEQLDWWGCYEKPWEEEGLLTDLETTLGLLAWETNRKKIGKRTYFPNWSQELLLSENHIVRLILICLSMGRLGCCLLALYVLALKPEASQSNVIILKHHLIQLKFCDRLPDPVNTCIPEHSLSSACFSSLISSESPLQSAIPVADFSAFPNPPRAFPSRTLHPTPHFCQSPVCALPPISKSNFLCRPPGSYRWLCSTCIGSNNEGKVKGEAGSITPFWPKDSEDRFV